MKCCAAAIIALALAGGGCGRSKPAAAPADGDSAGNPGDPDGGTGDTDDDTAADEVPPLVLPPECADAALPPTTLVCTGLYADIVGKQLAPGIEAYAPAVPLWSDGADKQRWISLPAGSTIDNADPNEWKFPVGTKVWKEFSRDGR
ncbi:MAG: hypothetical protein QOI66_4999, partial [Myxococcales bacterium]|nr:hypothetical protein [Myxococcales bacterium]